MYYNSSDTTVAVKVALQYLLAHMYVVAKCTICKAIVSQLAL